MNTTPAPTTRIYAGLLDADTEFFKTGNDLKVISKGSIFDFKDLPPVTFNILNESMKADAPALAILKQWYPNSEMNQLQKFTECRFGGLDYTPDISNNQLQHGEYWECPKRGKCIGEGIVCRNATYKGVELETSDIQLMKLLATNYTNEVIAEIHEVSFGQLHKLKKILYGKLNASTRQCVVNVLAVLNII
ncbi:hypothetical protein [Sediminibacter sp. Hel_I_10]|uniref:helix-turn-helix transcriptional regulator n=1 Tax=Sediminibacter sp. Hel_I_10 TaxID=1392490 RepID=UPI00047EC489|nr:hypothetical protein [Sediminibacter sp. Hel_I_10]